MANETILTVLQPQPADIIEVGMQGPAGANGKSAYEIAVSKGFQGTEDEWLISIGGTIDGSSQLNADWNATTGVTAILNKPTIPTLPTLAAVATTGDYGSLLNKPTIPAIPTNVSAFVNDVGYITDVSQKADKSYVDTQLATKGTSNFSGSYTDLTNKPTIPVVPTNISAFTNNAGYQTGAQVATTVNTAVDSAVSPINLALTSKVDRGELAAVATSGSYLDLLNKPTIPTTLPASDVYAWAKAATKPTYAYSEITGTPTIPTVPTTVSSFTNDSGYQTSTDVATAIAGKANTSSLSTVATTGSYTDLLNKPTIPAAQVQSDWDAVSGMGVILNKPTFTSTISGATDAAISNPANGEVLTYDSATAKWKNAVGGGAIPSYPDILGGLRSAGSGAIASNVSIGASVFSLHSTDVIGKNNVAIGNNTLIDDYATHDNIAVGFEALKNCKSGISAITITNGGTGYTTAPTVVISAPAAGGIQAVATCGVSGGAVIYVSVATAGRGYGTGVTVSFTGGGGSGATATATVNTGSLNVAIGSGALRGSAQSYEQVAIGYQAMYNHYTFVAAGAANVAVGAYALLGGSGNTNCVAVGFNALKGTQSNYVTAVGNNAGASGTNNTFSTFIGANSGNNCAAQSVTTVGYYAGSTATTGSTFIGASAGFLNSGLGNTCIGNSSLATSGNGTYNIAVGEYTLRYATTGSYNVALGHNALGALTTSTNNVAVGYQSLQAITSLGNSSTAVGYKAGTAVTTGTSNTLVGESAGILINTGNENTCVGRNAGNNITDGSNNTCIGYNALPSSASSTNQVTLGNGSITSLRCAATSITALSDKRDKADIAPLSYGIDFINSLNPISFTWNTRDGSKTGIAAAGFLAQELLFSQNEFGADCLDLVSTDNPSRLEARYGNLVSPMVKAIQDLSCLNDALVKRVEKLESILNKLI